MIEHLATLVDAFPGAPNQTRCFTHILNLTAKSILRQFDTRKSKKSNGGENDDLDLLDALAKELNDAAANICDDDDDDDDASAEDGLVDDADDEEEITLSEEELAKLDESLKPLRLLLTKV